MGRFFDGELPYEETIAKIKQHSRNYAKRQETWFRKHGAWTVFNPEDFKKIMKFLEEKLL